MLIIDPTSVFVRISFPVVSSSGSFQPFGKAAMSEASSYYLVNAEAGKCFCLRISLRGKVNVLA